MALARIITRSHACSRELALDLLARGYAVEIVSPDKIPDNIADLELRVDNPSGDQLIASVEAHGIEHSTSLEFVHHLKTPMLDFIRRTPEPAESFHIPDEHVSFDAQSNVDDVGLPADAPLLAARAVVPAPAEIPFESEPERASDSFSEEADHPVSPLQQLPSLTAEPLTEPAVEPTSHFAVEAVAILAPMTPLIAESGIAELTPADLQPKIARPKIGQPGTARATTAQPRTDRFTGWPLRAGLTFASVLLLALALGFGLRHTGNASAQGPGTLPAENVAMPSTDVNSPIVRDPEGQTVKDAGQISAVAAPTVVKPEASSSLMHNDAPAPVVKPKPSTTGTGAETVRRHDNDLIARDTVTYLDKRFEPAPKTKSAKRLAPQHAGSHKHGGVIAANSVTYLNNPAPKAPK